MADPDDSSATISKRVYALAASRLLKDLKRKRLGLVLAGGGAKGAYQIGCLKVLSDLDIKFQCIAGTSVGALNAAAIASSRVNEALDLWRQMSVFKILRLSHTALLTVVGATLGYFLIYRARFAFLFFALFLGAVLSSSLLVSGMYVEAICWPLLLLMFLVPSGQRTSHAAASLGRHLVRTCNSRSSISRQSGLRKLVREALFRNAPNHPIFRSKVYVTVSRERHYFDPDFPTFALEGPPPGDSDIHYAIDRPKPVIRWVPEYKNVSKLRADSVLDYLIQSAALPFVFQYGRHAGTYTSDGGLADNVPINALLADDLDEIWIIYLSNSSGIAERTLQNLKNVRRAERIQRIKTARLHRLYLRWKSMKLQEFMSDPEQDQRDYRLSPDDLVSGESYWNCVDLFLLLTTKLKLRTFAKIDAHYYNENDSHCWRLFHTWDLLCTRDATLVPMENRSDVPHLWHIVPGRSLGGLFTGTLDFRNSKARRLIEQGAADMVALLESRSRDHLFSARIDQPREPGSGSQ